MIRRDPIVEEVRKHREAIAREHGNDLEAIVSALEGDASLNDARTVSFSPKRLPKRPCAERPDRHDGPTRRWSRRRGPDASAPRPQGERLATKRERRQYENE